MDKLVFFKQKMATTQTNTSLSFIGGTQYCFNEHLHLSPFDSELNIEIQNNIRIDFFTNMPQKNTYWPIYCFFEPSTIFFDSPADALYLGAHWPELSLKSHLDQHTPSHLLLGIRDIDPKLLNTSSFISDRDLFLYQYNLQEHLNTLSSHVQLIIHLNFFATHLFPSSKPMLQGGPLWWQALLLIKDIFKFKNVTQVSILGFSQDCLVSQQNLALLLKKLLGYKQYFSQNKTELPLFSNN